MTEFIIFGIKEISKEKFSPIQNSIMNKPLNGLWASPYLKFDYYKSKWIEWCADNEYFKDDWIYGGVKFSLKRKSKILYIEDYQDFIDYMKPYYKTEAELFPDLVIPNYDRLSCCYTDIAKDYDGIFIGEDVIYSNRTRYGIKDLKADYHINYEGLSVYDVESLCLFNLDCIDQDTIEYIDMEYLKTE